MNKKMNKKQMLWASRRGMLELDLLLNPFIQQRFNHLSPVKIQQLIALLSEQDQDLYDWLLGKRRPRNADLSSIIGDIRNYHSTIGMEKYVDQE